MTPAWIIEELERQRREQARRNRPQLRIERDVPVQTDGDGPRPPPVVRIVIEFGPRSPQLETLVS
jgi:hypothetical protein